MKHLLFRSYGWIALIAFLIWCMIAAIYAKAADWRVFLISLSAIFSFVYFMQRQKLEELKWFKELFTDFNKRYDEINEGLNDIIEADSSEELSKEERHLLYKYFNLCGEEYLFYEQGYIYPKVWIAWHNGMQIFFQNERIKRLWEEELKTDSYYGLWFD